MRITDGLQNVQERNSYNMDDRALEGMRYRLTTSSGTTNYIIMHSYD